MMARTSVYPLECTPLLAEADQDIALLHATGIDGPLQFDDSDGESDEIEIARAVDVGHLRAFTADRVRNRRWCASLATSTILAVSSGTCVQSHVVEEEQRFRTLHDEVVHVHRDAVESDRVEHAHFDRDPQLGADAIGAGHKHRFLVVPLEELLVEVQPEHAGECAVRSENPWSMRLGHRALDLLDQFVAGDDVDPGLPVRQA